MTSNPGLISSRFLIIAWMVLACRRDGTPPHGPKRTGTGTGMGIGLGMGTGMGIGLGTETEAELGARSRVGSGKMLKMGQ